MQINNNNAGILCALHKTQAKYKMSEKTNDGKQILLCKALWYTQKLTVI